MIEYSVSEINGAIKTLLDRNLSEVCIRGEISGFKPASSGHWYFSLKDEDSIIRAVMFKFKAQSVDFAPRDGAMVLVYGSIDLYAKRGEYQINCLAMEQVGTGNLLLKVEELKKKLLLEGLFDQDRKKSLPLMPKKIAIITSPTGAVIQDILRILSRRAPGLDIVVVPTLVQGKDAAVQIARAIKIADREKLGDVLIVARGGGSLEDLMAFNEEIVVRAIADAELPIISAIGHETDTTLSDFAADLRAPTPSAASELVSESHQKLFSRLNEGLQFIVHSHKMKMRHLRDKLTRYEDVEFERMFQTKMHPYYQRLDDAKEDLLSDYAQKLKNIRLRINTARDLLESSSIQNILERGFAIIKDQEKNSIINSIKDIKLAQNIEVRLKDGKEIIKIEKEIK